MSICEMCQGPPRPATRRVAGTTSDAVTEDYQIMCCESCRWAAARAVRANEHVIGPLYSDPL